MREQHHFTNGRHIRQDHHQPINPETQAPTWWHAVLHRSDEVEVNHVSLFVAAGPGFGLGLEALQLLLRIVELGEGIAYLEPGDKGFETLHQARMAG